MCVHFRESMFNAINLSLAIVAFSFALIPGVGSIAHSFKVKHWMSVDYPRLMLKSIYCLYLLFQLCGFVQMVHTTRLYKTLTTWSWPSQRSRGEMMLTCVCVPL